MPALPIENIFALIFCAHNLKNIANRVILIIYRPSKVNSSSKNGRRKTFIDPLSSLGVVEGATDRSWLNSTSQEFV